MSTWRTVVHFFFSFCFFSPGGTSTFAPNLREPVFLIPLAVLAPLWFREEQEPSGQLWCLAVEEVAKERLSAAAYTQVSSETRASGTFVRTLGTQPRVSRHAKESAMRRPLVGCPRWRLCSRNQKRLCFSSCEYKCLSNAPAALRGLVLIGFSLPSVMRRTTLPRFCTASVSGRV